MQEEFFGPILPVLEVENVQQVIDFVNAKAKPSGRSLCKPGEHRRSFLMSKAMHLYKTGGPRGSSF